MPVKSPMPKPAPQSALQANLLPPPVPAPTAASPEALAPPAPASRPYRSDTWAFVFWSGCALMLAALLFKDLIVSLFKF